MGKNDHFAAFTLLRNYGILKTVRLTHVRTHPHDWYAITHTHMIAFLCHGRDRQYRNARSCHKERGVVDTVVSVTGTDLAQVRRRGAVIYRTTSQFEKELQ